MVSPSLTIVLPEGWHSSGDRPGRPRKDGDTVATVTGGGVRALPSSAPHMPLSYRKVLMRLPQRLTSVTPLPATDPSGQDAGLSESGAPLPTLLLQREPCPGPGHCSLQMLLLSWPGQAYDRAAEEGPEDREEPPRGTGGA